MDVDGIPVYNSVSEAVAKQGANVSALYTPAAFSADAIIEAIEAGIGRCRMYD
jgi:succinyl-CoA synthetase alpha subunit